MTFAVSVVLTGLISDESDLVALLCADLRGPLRATWPRARFGNRRLCHGCDLGAEAPDDLESATAAGWGF